MNIILLTDSYKLSHYRQYPEGTTRVYSYLEARKGGKFPKTLFFGLQYFIKKYLEGEVVTKDKIDEAEAFSIAHMGPGNFNREGWEHILNAHGGRLPVVIKAVPEGTLVPEGNVLVTVENTDPKCYWLTNYLETLLLQVWYPTTVGTLSYYMKATINEYLEKTGTPALIDFKLHDFGFRGVSSVESAGIGGAAHLVNFMGSDTLAAITLIRDFYMEDMAGFSIPASEHSTITSWTEAGEVEAMRNMLTTYPEGLVACVSDSYDIIRACREYWGKELKDLVLSRNGTLVVRPDSGEPEETVVEVLTALGEAFGYTINEKGYKVLPPQVRVIQGDGVNYESLARILLAMMLHGWSADNIAFGCGGALLQQMNRDTQRFAFKCSWIEVNGEGRDVFKLPKTDTSKKSKKGRMKLVRGWSDKEVELLQTVPEDAPGVDILDEVFRDGYVTTEYSFGYVRDRAKYG